MRAKGAATFNSSVQQRSRHRLDRAQIDEDLRRHLPLLQELAAFAHREKAFGFAEQALRPGQGPRELVREPAAAALEHQRAEMDQRLAEIKAWLALEQGGRAPLHDWMARFHKPDFVYREMMTDADRSRLLQWLNRGLDGSAESSQQWTSESTGLHFTATLSNRVSRELGQG